jgi:RNA recognition motif-containing protein
LGFILVQQSEILIMAKKLYVGNLPFDATDSELTELFSPHGDVQSVQIVTDRDTGRSRGFAFVEMSQGADAAIAALNGQDFKGRALTVNEAKPRKEGGGGGGRGGYRMGGGGGGGGRRGGFGGRRY